VGWWLRNTDLVEWLLKVKLRSDMGGLRNQNDMRVGLKMDSRRWVRAAAGGESVSSSGLICCAEFGDCKFSLSLSLTNRRTCGGVRLTKELFALCLGIYGFNVDLWICGFDVLGVHGFLLLMKCSWISEFMLLWIFVSIFFCLISVMFWCFHKIISIL
jgi:hypothetical protein